MKHEWKKHEKNIYLPGLRPVLVTVPQQNFFMISGKGNPNDEEFSEKVAVLYSMAYAVRMMPNRDIHRMAILNILYIRLKGYGI